MKKALTILSVAFLAVGLSSCDLGDYSCNCTYTATGETKTVEIMEGVSEADAQEACAAQESQSTLLGGATCTINKD